MALPQQSHTAYSYADYFSWDDQERWELINGEAWAMSPAPSRLHQAVSARLFYALFSHFQEKNCEVYAAPFDVRLPATPDTKAADDTEITTVVQPDISVICDRKKLDDRGCVGAPDLVIEILSPSTAAKDLKVKRLLYEQHGVTEYWLLHPTDKIAMLYTLINNSQNSQESQESQYGKARVVDRNDVLTSDQFDQLQIALASVFIDE